MNYCVLDVGGTFVKAALMDEELHILDKWKIPSVVGTPDEFMDCLKAAIDRHAGEFGGIAISMPGRIDVETGTAITAGAFTQVVNYPMGQVLSDYYHVPVSVDNDGKCAAMAELASGSLKGVKCGAVLALGTGIGGGIIINGDLWRGAHYSAGELSFGLMSLRVGCQPENMICQYYSGISLMKTHAINAGLETPLSGEEFFALLETGDACAAQTLEDFCAGLAHFIFELHLALDFDKVAIGGGISAQPILLETLRRKFHETYTETEVQIPAPECELVVCEYRNDANLIGALQHHLKRVNA